jgi:hypothetical protein
LWSEHEDGIPVQAGGKHFPHSFDSNGCFAATCGTGQECFGIKWGINNILLGI